MYKYVFFGIFGLCFRNWKSEKEAVRLALINLMQEITFLWILPNRMWTSWKIQVIRSKAKTPRRKTLPSSGLPPAADR